MVSRRTVIGAGAVGLAGAGTVWSWTHAGGARTEMAEAQRASLATDPAMADLVRFATLAANGHNTQPWQFRLRDNGIDILPDLSRRTPVVDPDDHHLWASMGCAAENLSIAAQSAGLSGHISFGLPDTEGLRVALDAAPPISGDLLRAIPLRQSTRADYDGRPIPTEVADRLIAAASHHGVDAIYISDQIQKQQLSDLVIAGNTAQMVDPGFVQELKDWIRFSPSRAMKTGDGLFSGCSGNPALPEWVGPTAFDWVFNTEAENDKYVRQIRSSGGLIVLVARGNTPKGWSEAGQACQRLSLQATADGLKHSFVNQTVEVPTQRQDLQRLLGLGDRRPNLVLRLGYGNALPYSLRRPVADVIV